MEQVHYLGGVQRLFDAIAVQTVTLLAMHVWKKWKKKVNVQNKRLSRILGEKLPKGFKGRGGGGGGTPTLLQELCSTCKNEHILLGLIFRLKEAKVYFCICICNRRADEVHIVEKLWAVRAVILNWFWTAVNRLKNKVWTPIWHSLFHLSNARFSFVCAFFSCLLSALSHLTNLDLPYSFWPQENYMECHLDHHLTQQLRFP